MNDTEIQTLKASIKNVEAVAFAIGVLKAILSTAELIESQKIAITEAIQGLENITKNN